MKTKSNQVPDRTGQSHKNHCQNARKNTRRPIWSSDQQSTALPMKLAGQRELLCTNNQSNLTKKKKDVTILYFFLTDNHNGLSMGNFDLKHWPNNYVLFTRSQHCSYSMLTTLHASGTVPIISCRKVHYYERGFLDAQ